MKSIFTSTKVPFDPILSNCSNNCDSILKGEYFKIKFNSSWCCEGKMLTLITLAFGTIIFNKRSKNGDSYLFQFTLRFTKRFLTGYFPGRHRNYNLLWKRKPKQFFFLHSYLNLTVGYNYLWYIHCRGLSESRRRNRCPKSKWHPLNKSEGEIIPFELFKLKL